MRRPPASSGGRPVHDFQTLPRRFTRRHLNSCVELGCEAADGFVLTRQRNLRLIAVGEVRHVIGRTTDCAAQLAWCALVTDPSTKRRHLGNCPAVGLGDLDLPGEMAPERSTGRCGVPKDVFGMLKPVPMVLDE